MSSARETLSRREVIRASDDAVRAAEQANVTLLRMRDDLAKLRRDLEARDARTADDLGGMSAAVADIRADLSDVEADAGAALGEIRALVGLRFWSRLRWLLTGRWK